MAATRMKAMIAGALAAMAVAIAPALSQGLDAHNAPWRDPTRALVLDAYEYNEIEWEKVVTDKRIAGFIGKATDGLPTEYGCTGAATVKDLQLCKLAWRRYAMSKELYHTRKAVAKALGLKWGAYHLARAGNPIQQADHFLDFTKPEPDDLIALDIEENNPREFLSLEDAEVFARRIHARIGRYPVLYTNGSTAKYIAANHARYPLLSRMKLWYARYKPIIGEHFPKGHWQSYTLWQFASHINCSKRACPYRVPGTNRDIDVNVAMMSVPELRAAWPFDGLVPASADPFIAEERRNNRPVDPETIMLAKVPVPAANPGAHPSGTHYATAASIVPVTSYLVPRKPTVLVSANTDTTIKTGSLRPTAASRPPANASPFVTAYAPAATQGHLAGPFAALLAAKAKQASPMSMAREFLSRQLASLGGDRCYGALKAVSALLNNSTKIESRS